MVLEHEHDPERVPLYRFLGPRFWPLWLGLGLGRCLGRGGRLLRRSGAILGHPRGRIYNSRAGVVAVDGEPLTPERHARPGPVSVRVVPPRR